jgi:hypothetical protein
MHALLQMLELRADLVPESCHGGRGQSSASHGIFDDRWQLDMGSLDRARQIKDS